MAPLFLINIFNIFDDLAGERVYFNETKLQRIIDNILINVINRH